jgi:hypothetical protein
MVGHVHLYLCVRGIDFVFVPTIFILDFDTVLTEVIFMLKNSSLLKEESVNSLHSNHQYITNYIIDRIFKTFKPLLTKCLKISKVCVMVATVKLSKWWLKLNQYALLVQ